MAKEFFKNLPDTSTPLNASRLNGLLNGNEAMGNIVVGDVKCKNLFNINGAYTEVTGSPTISGDSISVPNSSGNGGYTKFIQKIEVNGSLTFSCGISGSNGYARLLLIPLDSNGNVVTDLEIEGYTYLALYGGYYGDISNGEYELVLDSPENVKYFQLGFVHINATFTNIQIEEGTTATEYVPYKKIGYNELLKIQHTETLNLSTNTTYFGNFSLDVPEGYEVINIIVIPQYSDKTFGLANPLQDAKKVYYCIFVNYPTQQNNVTFYIYCKKTDEIITRQIESEG